jgi:hypothetical protein
VRHALIITLVSLFVAPMIGSGSAAQAEVIQQNGIRVGFQGTLTPKRLPRQGVAPIHVALAARISGAAGAKPPQLRRIEIAINRHGRFDPSGLPVCQMRDIQPTTNTDALRACRGSLVGEGEFSAQVDINGQAPYPSMGKLLAFNGSYHGVPAILAHVFGTEPVPTSYTLPFLLKASQGTFGTRLVAALPDAAGGSSYVTGISLSLGRSYSFDGARHSYLSANCPAPSGFPAATFPFARASFDFGEEQLTSTLTRSCKVSR